jgi:hypothetical protein
MSSKPDDLGSATCARGRGHSRYRKRVCQSGFPDAAERQAKLRLAYALNQVLAADLSDFQAAACRIVSWRAPNHYSASTHSVSAIHPFTPGLPPDSSGEFTHLVTGVDPVAAAGAPISS